MSDLISTPELIDWLRGKKYITVDETSDIMSEDFENKHQWELSRNCFINDTIKHIQGQPSIEAEPVRHGEWIGENNSGAYDDWYCSKCYTYAEVRHKHRLGKYCGECGAKMGGVKNNG